METQTRELVPAEYTLCMKQRECACSFAIEVLDCWAHYAQAFGGCVHFVNSFLLQSQTERRRGVCTGPDEKEYGPMASQEAQGLCPILGVCPLLANSAGQGWHLESARKFALMHVLCHWCYMRRVPLCLIGLICRAFGSSMQIFSRILVMPWSRS